jgi:hypothetical protein
LALLQKRLGNRAGFPQTLHEAGFLLEAVPQTSLLLLVAWLPAMMVSAFSVAVACRVEARRSQRSQRDMEGLRQSWYTSSWREVMGLVPCRGG